MLFRSSCTRCRDTFLNNFVKDVLSCFLSTSDCFFYDLSCKTVDLNIHLNRCDTCYELWATPHNVAYQAKVSCSSALSQEQEGKYVIDQVIRISGKGEWVAKTKLDARGRVYPYPWIQLDWDHAIYTNKVILYDRVDERSHCAAGTLFFSDGSSVTVNLIPNDGAPRDRKSVV